MRLSSEYIHQIRKIANQIYGDDVRVVLFGSRTDDKARGGDIDLLIETPQKERMNFENKIKFLTTLKLAIGDQKIDVIYKKDKEGNAFSADSKNNNGSDIVSNAIKTGVEL
jgi:predicted nucleotidyltransferase